MGGGSNMMGDQLGQHSVVSKIQPLVSYYQQHKTLGHKGWRVYKTWFKKNTISCWKGIDSTACKTLMLINWAMLINYMIHLSTYVYISFWHYVHQHPCSFTWFTLLRSDLLLIPYIPKHWLTPWASALPIRDLSVCHFLQGDMSPRRVGLWGLLGSEVV